MTPLSLSGAIERQTKRAMQPAAAPMQNAYQPELVPNLPSLEVESPPVLIAEPARTASGLKVTHTDEGADAFFELTASLIDHYQPATIHEHSLIEDLARERWVLLRRQRAFSSIESDIYERQPEPAKWSETEFKRLALAERYRVEAERAFERSLKSVKSFCKERITNYRWTAMYDLAVRHLDFEKKKHELKRMDAGA
jgi:hypothetical protein